MANQTIYAVGGAVQAGEGTYIKRKADNQLLEHCRAGDLSFILSSRQVGKSSLMYHTARQLESENIRSVIIDLNMIGVDVSVDEWYLGILNEISNTLDLKTDILGWWSGHSDHAPAQRMTNFFRDVLLKEVSQPIVLFFDEIDSMLSLSFSRDDFFAALHALYDARSTMPEFKRLSFVLIGATTSSDLITDEKHTPFNIGYRVELTDFTPEEAIPLASDLTVLDWVFHWTGGHPYLTQRLCVYLSKAKTTLTEKDVADAVKSLFEGEQGQQDVNLQFVHSMLINRSPHLRRTLLDIYKEIRSGKKVRDDERSIPREYLKISGIARCEHGQLVLRNRIYERAFDLAWIKENAFPVTAISTTIISTNIYTVGGTVQASGGIYIPRKADDELLGYCRAGEFAFILSSRQVGKSSLMVRTARQLESENTRSVIIDLSSIGVRISTDEWYLGILDEITNTLKLQTDIFSWWSERTGLSPATRMTNFFRDVLLKEVSEPVVLFFDEIDSTLSIPFADDFFAALRAMYNARSTVSDFKRLSFVLIGVATPSDLISDSARTPFNIGRRVELTDFTLEELHPLAKGLGENAEQVLGWIFDWTNGHPYLTQRLCAHLSRKSDFKSDLQEEDVANAVKQLFEGEQGRQDNNLQFVRDMLTKRAPDIQRVLKTYKDIRSGNKVIDDERSIPKAHLKISGVVRRKNGRLQPRNRIYERTFDLAWIKENTPPATSHRLVIVSSLIAIIALVIAGYFYQQQTQASDILAKTYIDNFNSSNSQEVKITNLAGLFGLGDQYASQARELFDALDHENKLALFNDLATPANVGNELAIVANGVYQNVENTQEGNTLLRAIANVLRKTESTDALKLEPEITAWVDGREAAGNGQYSMAIDLYNRAFNYSKDRGNKNAAILMDSAVVYTMLEQFAKALADYDNAVGIDKNRANEVKKVVLGSQLLTKYLRDNLSSYPNLLSSIAIPTELPTPIFTKITITTSLPSTETNTPAFSCINVPTPRVQVGDTARVTFIDGRSVRLRSSPDVGDNAIDSLPEGTEFEIIGGPICYPRPNRNDAFIFWEISVPSRTNTGWVAEGDLKDYYIEPLP